MDVVVLATSFFHALQTKGLSELWILFGSGRKQRFLPIHQIAIKLGESEASALRGFHAFTGCDTVSAFAAKGKRTAWMKWNSYESVTDAFPAMSNPGTSLQQSDLKLLEGFVVILYRADIELQTVNAARKDLFASKSKSVNSLLPTSDALAQHVLRATYQGGHIWGQSYKIITDLPSPGDWGWTPEGKGRTPKWIKQPTIWQACRELVKHGCRQGCNKNKCTCASANVPCTLMCALCKGEC